MSPAHARLMFHLDNWAANNQSKFKREGVAKKLANNKFSK
ncbi:hypothetical protein Sps_00554 [Shewanella psychrophila]|uniref:Uncharacterized protein n=1 Tax=Shewanella psychrophila TaxID=225848 RepID=A0A1S6HJQ7_9GAMM|nr:hypothetical protein Sps_00554 [Shewanella psychrophila]